MKITSIEPQRKKVDRVNIYIDGRFAFGLSAALLFEGKLKIGQEISEEKIKELIEKDQVERLVNKALKFLSYRPRSERELREYLSRKGRLSEVSSEVEEVQYSPSVGKAIKWLKKLGQINDTAFAKWWTEQRLKFKPKALSLIKRELSAKGVAQEVIEDVINAVEKEKGVAEEDLAAKVANKKLRSYKNLEAEDFKIKLGRYLARKGFSWEIIKKVVDTLIEKRVK